MSIPDQTMNASVTVSQSGVAVLNTDTKRGHIHRVANGGDLGAKIGQSFDFPTIYTTSSIPVDFDPSQFLIQERLEGTILRIWLAVQPDGTLKLYASTHKIPDISEGGSWGARSFHKAASQFVYPKLKLENMAPGAVYIVLLQDTENKMGCKCENGGVHLATLVNDETSPCGFTRVERDIGLPKPNEHTFSTRQELVDALNELDSQVVGERSVAGFVALSKNPQDMSTINLISDGYDAVIEARNNEPHLMKRVSELWDQAHNKGLSVEIQVTAREHLQTLNLLFPEYAEVFADDFANRLHDCVTMLNDLYKRRHIQNEIIELPKPVHFFMMSLRNRHVESRRRAKADPSQRVFYASYNTIMSSLQHIPICEAIKIMDWTTEWKTRLAAVAAVAGSQSMPDRWQGKVV